MLAEIGHSPIQNSPFKLEGDTRRRILARFQEQAMIEWFEDLSLGMRFKSETTQVSEDDIKQFAAKFDPHRFI